MDTHKRARAFTIEVEVTDEILLFCSLDAFLIFRVQGTGQSILCIVGDMQCIIKISGLDHCQHRSEDFFLRNTRMWVYISDHSGFDKVARLLMPTASNQATFLLAYLDIVGDLLHCVF